MPKQLREQISLPPNIPLNQLTIQRKEKERGLIMSTLRSRHLCSFYQNVLFFDLTDTAATVHAKEGARKIAPKKLNF